MSRKNITSIPEPFAVGDVVTHRRTGEPWHLSHVERSVAWLYAMNRPGTMTVRAADLPEHFTLDD